MAPTEWCRCECLECTHGDHCRLHREGCYWHQEPKFYVPPAASAASNLFAFGARLALDLERQEDIPEDDCDR